jgi:hypothetical protein
MWRIYSNPDPHWGLALDILVFIILFEKEVAE